MLNLNKNKLIPATEIIAYWGEIKGDISKQTDLVELTTDLDTSIKGWVESKGYVTAETLPEGIATESWVQSQGYLTQHQDFKTINNESIVGSGNIEVGLTPEQDKAVDLIVNPGDGFLKHTPYRHIIGARRAEIWTEGKFAQQDLHLINGDIYLHNRFDSILYKFNKQTYQFEEGLITSQNPINEHLWIDSQGRCYSNNNYIVDLETGIYTQWNMGGDFMIHTGSNFTNIIESGGVVYMVSFNNACAYIFNEETQSFDSSIPVQGKFPSSTFYRNFSKFENRWIYDVGQEQTELVFHLDEAEPYAEWVVLPERLFPGAWSYEYNGQTINESTRGVYVHPVVKDGVTEYYNWGYRNPVMYKLVNGAWEIVPFTMDVANYKSQVSGVSIDDIWLGYGYVSGSNSIIMWNLGPDKSIPEYYGWIDLDSEIKGINRDIKGINRDIKVIKNDIINTNTTVENNISRIYDILTYTDTLDSRISALETNYGDALNITNQILG